jgi:hypothetical protein
MLSRNLSREYKLLRPDKAQMEIGNEYVQYANKDQAKVARLVLTSKR